MNVVGKAIVLGDNVNTDLLHPPAFFSSDKEKVVAGAFAGLGLDLAKLGPPPYVVLAGKNFGCGSSRESTMNALKGVGVAAFVARSFAHIFRRNALNQGVWPLVTHADISGATTGERVCIDLVRKVLSIEERVHPLEAPDDYEIEVLLAEGLLPLLEAYDMKWPWE
jgi:3-isopropylmalate/(R)-2-methylmalate dehydratase small subunit/methanogen homoaconitase small subunit